MADVDADSVKTDCAKVTSIQTGNTEKFNKILKLLNHSGKKADETGVSVPSVELLTNPKLRRKKHEDL